MASALDIIKAVNPPRAAFLDYPLGHTTGKPHEPALQRAIMRAALDAFTSLTTPGSVKMLPFRWTADDAWKEAVQRGPDSRRPRYDTPQYQTDKDRLQAEAHNPAPCAPCKYPGKSFSATLTSHGAGAGTYHLHEHSLLLQHEARNHD